MSINNATISGSVGKYSELRQTASGTDVLKFKVAVNENRKDANGEWQEETSWIPCVLFGERAKKLHLNDRLQAGTKVTVSGKLNYSIYEKEGEKRANFSIIVSALDIHTPSQSADQAQTEQDISF